MSLLTVQNRFVSQQRKNHLLQVFFFLLFLLFLVFSACFNPLLLPMLCTSIFLFVDEEYILHVLEVHFHQESFSPAFLKISPHATLFLCFSPGLTGKEPL